MNLLYLTEDDVRQTLDMREAVSLAEKGIRADAEGKVQGDKFYMSAGENGFIKPFSGYLEGEEFAYVKIFSFFPDNPSQHNLPTTASQVLLYDARTGMPVCLMEAGWVTGLKTGASTAVTARYLACPDSENVVIFGAGLQGRMHLRGLSLVLPLKRAWLLDINPQATESLIAELTPEVDFPITAVPLTEREGVVRQADVVVTVTTGNQPLVQRDWLKSGAFVAKLGSYQELSLDVITGADKVIVDRWKYVRPRVPELVRLAEEDRFGKADLHAEWPRIVAGERPGRESPSEVIVYIALGIWGEYAAILPEVYRQARQKGLGRELSPSI